MGLGKYLRRSCPKFYQYFQEALGEFYYELLGCGWLVRAFCKTRLRRSELTSADPIETAVNYSGVSPYGTIEPCQRLFEIRKLCRIVQQESPEVICEIGTDMGGTLYCWAKAAPSNASFISVDLPRFYRKSLNRFFASFFANGQQCNFVRANSHNEDCKNQIKEILAGRKIDFLFIDGDHSYEGVKQDFLRYRDFVRDGGIIALHDIVKDTVEEWRCNVEKFWAELKPFYEHTEIISDPNQSGTGIGVVKYDPSVDIEMLLANSDELDFRRDAA